MEISSSVIELLHQEIDHLNHKKKFTNCPGRAKGNNKETNS